MDKVASLSLIGIPTRNRPASLRRCVLSHIAGAKLQGRLCEFVVVDDSDDESIRLEQRELLQSLRREHDCPIALAGVEEKQRFVTAIARLTGCSADVLAFGLLNPLQLPIATGASRNALLLHSAGELLLQVDDDTEARLAPVPGATADVATTTRFDPTEFWFFNEAELAATAGELPIGDLAALHERWLGQARPGGRVLASMAGVLGDSGMGSSLHFLNLQGASRDRLLVSEAAYRGALSQHRVLRAVQQPTIAAGAVCMALNLGLDHRTLLPPFFPVQRNQDGIFGALLRTCCGGALSAFLPAAVLHQPPQPRARSLQEIEAQVGRLTSGQMVQGLIWTLGAAPPGSDTAANLRAVGAAMIKLSKLAPGAFADLLLRLVRKQLEHLAAQWETSLRRHDEQPIFWADDLRRWLTSLRCRLAEPDAAVPADFNRIASPAPAPVLLQQLVGQFGQLLDAWPVIVAAARDLRASGHRLAQPI